MIAVLFVVFAGVWGTSIFAKVQTAGGFDAPKSQREASGKPAWRRARSAGTPVTSSCCTPARHAVSCAQLLRARLAEHRPRPGHRFGVAGLPAFVRLSQPDVQSVSRHADAHKLNVADGDAPPRTRPRIALLHGQRGWQFRV